MQLKCSLKNISMINTIKEITHSTDVCVHVAV